MYKSSMDFDDSDLLVSHLSEFAGTGAQKYGARTAFSCVLPTGHTASMSYTDLDHHSDAVAVYLRSALGLLPGDVVAIQSPNTLSYPVVAFGILKAGLTATNINPLYTVDETNHQLKDSGAKALFVIDVFGDRVADAVKGTGVSSIFKLSLLDFFPAVTGALLKAVMTYIKKVVPPMTVKVDGDMKSVVKAGAALVKGGAKASAFKSDMSVDDIAFYQYTGGTTGRSKGARLSHRNVVANVSQGHKINHDAINPDGETMMLVLPLYHVYALAVGAMTSMNNGTHVVLVPAPRPLANLRHVFKRFDITVMPGINTLYLGLMQEKWFTDNPPTTLKYCYSGAAPLQPSTAEAWYKLTGASIYEGYGLTEGTCAVSTMPLSETPRRGTCGKPLPGTELRIVGEDGSDQPAGEPGELWVRGPQVMQGYLNRPEATKECITDEGWLKTGDVAVVDKDGWLAIVDRMKDMIIVSGFNVYPTDIEDVLTQHDAVADAAVVGVPHASTGECVVAYVVPGSKDLTVDAIKAHCREHLTAYKVPKIVELVPELPKSPVGKVLRRELRDMARTQHAA